MQSQDLGSSAHQESPGNQDQSVVSDAGNNDSGNDITSLLDNIRELPLSGHSFDTNSPMAQGEGQKTYKKEDTESAVRAEESSSSSMKGVDNQLNSSDKRRILWQQCYNMNIISAVKQELWGEDPHKSRWEDPHKSREFISEMCRMNELLELIQQFILHCVKLAELNSTCITKLL